jgi:hypothetical protein
MGRSLSQDASSRPTRRARSLGCTASFRAEAVQPKLRARRVGRELASCESDLPIR